MKNKCVSDNIKFKVCVRCKTYNHAPYIEDALNGFCMQNTMFPFVCVIVDDASTDGEQRVIGDYIQENFDVRNAIHEENDNYILKFVQHKNNLNCYFAIYYLKYNHWRWKSTEPYILRWQDVGNKSKFEAWDENLIAPPAQNVLNVAIYLSLFWGYNETYIIGADSSFLEDLRVDQETNELYTIDRHFYTNTKVHSDKSFYDSQKRGRSRADWTLHELIYAHGRMFEYYYELKKYADYKGLKVYNASEYSWINVFERRKLR